MLAWLNCLMINENLGSSINVFAIFAFMLPHGLLHSGSSSVIIFLIINYRGLGGCLEAHVGG